MNNNQQAPAPVQGQREIKLVDNIPGGEYANNMQSFVNSDEIQLIFMNLFANSGRVVSKIISSPGHFKRMAVAMESILKTYEEKFGKIKEVEGSQNKEIGFKA